MDIRCVKCGEPWDLDSLHDQVDPKARNGQKDGFGGKLYSSFSAARKAFYRDGCELFGASHGPIDPEKGAVVAALQDLAGDDIDGLASDIEDAEALGLL